MNFDEVIAFWFHEATPQQHFAKDASFDARIRERFLSTYHAAARGELSSWRDAPDGRLAEIIVLDQFSRNLFRDNPQAFACDLVALVLAQEAVRAGDDKKVEAARRSFLYMPFMHSESISVHREAYPLFHRLGDTNTLKYEDAHMAIIERFGRYPHRNAVLGRSSTDEEIAFIRDNKGF